MPFADMNWQPARDAKAIPSALREMILDQHSLTRRLKQAHNNNFFVRVISHDWQEPDASEKAFLHCDDQRASIREVLLFGSGQPVVFARSVLPESSLSGENRVLLELGDRPLGEYIFSQPGLCRGPIEVTDIKASEFNAHLDVEFTAEIAWARRSLFFLRDKPISVCEVFLPERESRGAVWEYLDAGKPVISIDTKKKELLGNFYRDGVVDSVEPVIVNDHE